MAEAASQPSADSVAEFLETSAQIIERDGWTQGRSGNPTVGWCAIGAMNEVTRYLRQLHHCNAYLLNGAAVESLADHVRAEHSEWVGCGPGHLIPAWNDRPDRTAEDVTNAMRKTALTLREQA